MKICLDYSKNLQIFVGYIPIYGISKYCLRTAVGTPEGTSDKDGEFSKPAVKNNSPPFWGMHTTVV